MGRRVTIADVARTAAVSASTVSKALNEAGEIPAATRERIREVADRLGYRPSALARGLRAGLTRCFGAVTDDDEGVFSTALTRGLEHYAAERGFSVFLSHSLGEPERERRHVQAFLDHRVDGLIVMDGVVRSRPPVGCDTGDLPLVYVYCYPDALQVPAVVPDDLAAGREAAAHLLDLGRRRIAYVSGPTRGRSAFEASATRRDGIVAAHAAAGRTLAPGLVVPADWDPRSGYLAAQRLLELPDPPDAVVAASDYVAAGVLEAVRLSGRRVPDDVAVVGFDDRRIAATLPVPLTTVAVAHDEIGRLAIATLFDGVDGHPQQRSVTRVPGALVVRESTAGPHRAH